MKHFLTVYFTIMTCLAFSQTPNRTVNFTSTVAGASKFTSITTALSGAASGTTIWVAAGTYTEAELIIPAGVTVIGGFPPPTQPLTNSAFILGWPQRLSYQF